MELVWRGNNTIAEYQSKYRKPFQLIQINTLSVSSWFDNEKSYIALNICEHQISNSYFINAALLFFAIWIVQACELC